MLPGPAVPGCCLISFHFLWAIHPIRPVMPRDRKEEAATAEYHSEGETREATLMVFHGR